jgi:hypothetical protein
MIRNKESRPNKVITSAFIISLHPSQASPVLSIRMSGVEKSGTGADCLMLLVKLRSPRCRWASGKKGVRNLFHDGKRSWSSEDEKGS